MNGIGPPQQEEEDNKWPAEQQQKEDQMPSILVRNACWIAIAAVVVSAVIYTISKNW